MTTTVVTLEWTPASEPGALDGWTLHCTQCGRLHGCSLLGMATRDAHDHEHWHTTEESK